VRKRKSITPSIPVQARRSWSLGWYVRGASGT
jgi:hypothetical protein